MGGFPEAISRRSERRRQDWARSYLTSVLTRDLRDIAEIEKLTDLPRFVRLLAEMDVGGMNESEGHSLIGARLRDKQSHAGGPDRSG